jgi:hypothetical protein
MRAFSVYFHLAQHFERDRKESDIGKGSYVEKGMARSS